MGVILIIILEIIIMFLFKTFNMDTTNLIFFEIINFMAMIFWCLSEKSMSKKQKKVLIIGIITRFLVLFINKFYPLPFAHDNADADSFHRTAINISNNLSLLKTSVYGGSYSKALGILYYLIGPNRFFIESIYSMLSISTIYYIFNICNKYIGIKENNKCSLLYYLLVLFPQGLLYSISIRREALIVYFVILSLYFCIKYIHTRKQIDFIMTYIPLILASTLHAGILFIAIGYILLMSFYNKKTEKLNITTKKVMYFIIIGILSIFIFAKYGNIIAPKISNIDEEKIISTYEKNSRGGSAYLGGKEINNTKDIIVYTSAKIVYFLFSPMLWDCRGINDYISVLLDSSIYMILILSIIINIKYAKGKKRAIAIMLLIGLSISILAFAIGTSNAGTAMRHRYKLFDYIVFINILLINMRDKKVIKNEK